MNQIALDFTAARAEGDAAGQRCAAKAARIDPEFSKKAEAAIMAHLHVVGQASGEALTDIAVAVGARPHDARAFGPVFKSLARRGLIRTVGFCTRTKGHGTAGGRIWGLCR
jgi:hypothetical protein